MQKSPLNILVFRCLLAVCLMAVLPSAGFAGGDVVNVRLGVHSDRTRIVLDLSAPADYRIEPQTDPERIVIALEGCGVRLAGEAPAGRGLIRPGYAADLAIFDPATVNAGEPEWVTDFPANTRRLAQPSVGLHYTVVNGEVVYEDGRLSDALAGHVLRGAGTRARAVATG